MPTVTIIYKSGAKVQLDVKELTVKKRGAQITAVDWAEAEPRVLHLGVDDIAAIYEGKV